MIKDSEKGQRRIHATQKPVALAEWVFDYYKDISTVLDLFGGSGSTLMAAEKQGKIAFLMELMPQYCDVIVKRWQDFTGQKATLESTGRTFEDMASDPTRSNSRGRRMKAKAKTGPKPHQPTDAMRQDRIPPRHCRHPTGNHCREYLAYRWTRLQRHYRSELDTAREKSQRQCGRGALQKSHVEAIRHGHDFLAENPRAVAGNRGHFQRGRHAEA
jgi:hypothetical protein